MPRLQLIHERRKLRHLSHTDRRLLLSAVCLHGAVALGLRLVHYGTLCRLLERLSEWWGTSDKSKDVSVDRVAWAVAASGARLPWQPGCLAAAFVGRLLLQRHGYQAHLRFAVQRENAVMYGHACVEVHGTIVIGAEAMSGYAPLGKDEA